MSHGTSPAGSADVDGRLTAHLRSWLGAWPPRSDLDVVGSNARTTPGWDGVVRPVNGVATPHGTVLSVAPALVERVRASGSTVGEIGARLPDLLDRPGGRFGMGVFRWSTAPTPSDDPGVWVPPDADGLPAWLRPFNGDVLVGYGRGDRRVAAGVGRKQHDPFGHELAVVTEEGFRGQGWARRLVTQAARRVLDDGAVPVYLHATENTASARTADASGFPDHGWRILGFFGGDAGDGDARDGDAGDRDAGGRDARDRDAGDRDAGDRDAGG